MYFHTLNKIMEKSTSPPVNHWGRLSWGNPEHIKENVVDRALGGMEEHLPDSGNRYQGSYIWEKGKGSENAPSFYFLI